jgi:hypothetical protein
LGVFTPFRSRAFSAGENKEFMGVELRGQEPWSDCYILA